MQKYIKPKLKRCVQCNQVRTIEAFKVVRLKTEKRHSSWCCLCLGLSVENTNK